VALLAGERGEVSSALLPEPQNKGAVTGQQCHKGFQVDTLSQYHIYLMPLEYFIDKDSIIIT